MSNNTTTAANSFPLLGIAALLTIGLAVANVAGWIHVAWWVVWLPIAIAVGITFTILIVMVVVLAIGFGIYLIADKRSSKRTGYITPARHRGIK